MGSHFVSILRKYPVKVFVCLLSILAVSCISLPSASSQISGKPIQSTTPIPPKATASVSGQPADTEDQTYNGLAGIGFMVAMPQNAFGDTLDKFGYGINLYGAYAPSSAGPFAVGLDLGFTSYGNENFTQPLGNGALSRINVTIETSYNLVTGHTFLRLQPDLKFALPYIEGLVGFHYLYTSSDVKSQSNNPADVPFASSTNYDDIALSYGIGGGLGIKLYSEKPEYKDGIRTNFGGAIYLDMRVRYLIGGKAEYLKPGVSITNGKDANGNDIPLYSPSTSTTDLLTAQLGLSFRF